MEFIRNYYFDEGKTCAVGYLAQQCGVSDATLKGASVMAIVCAEDDYCTEVGTVARAILKRYPNLTLDDLDELQTLNDKRCENEVKEWFARYTDISLDHVFIRPF